MSIGQRLNKLENPTGGGEWCMHLRPLVHYEPDGDPAADKQNSKRLVSDEELNRVCPCGKPRIRINVVYVSGRGLASEGE